MGLHHARSAAALPAFEVLAGCDLDAELTQKFVEQYPNARAFTDYSQMLHEIEPEVVLIATSTASHAPLAMQAIEAGARGIFCEKPMSVSLGEARAMTEACRRRNVALAVNHQRRTYPVFRETKRLMESGAIGDVQLIRGSCQGDILSDGTHLIDTVRFLVGDVEAKWVFGQIYRKPDESDQTGQSGFRYGHAVESGGMALIEFANGIRAEIYTGTMHIKKRQYQDYEIFGTQGRIWRAGDQADPPILIQNDQASGWHTAEFNDEAKPWLENHAQFACMIHEGGDHPLSGDSAFKDQEIVMAIYESARLRSKIELPLQQDEYPLQIMIDNGQL
jgi:predicted dehydrogenase